MQKNNIRSHFHCVYNLNYHLVLVTKYRKKCFSNQILAQLEDIMNNVTLKWDCEILEFGGEPDHVHLLIKAHPAMDMSKYVNNLKTVSSRLIKKKYPKHFKRFYWKPALWTRSYCLLTTGGATVEVIKKYIEKQGGQNSSPP